MRQDAHGSMLKVAINKIVVRVRPCLMYGSERLGNACYDMITFRWIMGVKRIEKI